MGDLGNSSEKGKISNAEFSKAIQNGLADSNHSKLDTLIEVACTRSEIGALSEISKVTEHDVSSAEVMQFSTKNSEKIDAINLIAPLKNLLNNPNMNGEQLAQTFTMEANNRSNADPTLPACEKNSNGTLTLAHFDLQQYPQFNTALNIFGEQLSKAIQDSQNRAVIEKIIEKTPIYDYQNQSSDQKRDLRSFAESVKMAITTEHSLSDPSGNLLLSVNSLLDKEQRLTKSYYGDLAGGYDKLGGLSVFLPSQSFSNIELTAEQNCTSICALIKDTSSIVNEEKCPDQKDRQEDGEHLQQMVQLMKQQLVAVHAEKYLHQLESVENAVSRLQSADAQHYFSAARDLYATATSLQTSPVNQALAQIVIPSLSKLRQSFYQIELDTTSGWNNFIRQLLSTEQT
jgi:hypothetical protein